MSTEELTGSSSQSSDNGILVEVSDSYAELLALLEEQVGDYVPADQIEALIDLEPSEVAEMVAELNMFTRSVLIKSRADNMCSKCGLVPHIFNPAISTDLWLCERCNDVLLGTPTMDLPLSPVVKYATDNEPTDVNSIAYRIEFFDLEGAKVPLGKTFEHKEIVEIEKPVIEYVDKIVEKEIIVTKPVPVEVGAALKPKILTRRAKVKSARAKTKEKDNGYVWPDEPELIAPDPNFIVPPHYGMMEAMVGLGKHVALRGPAGIGKSYGVLQLSAKYKRPLATYSASGGLHKRDLEGTPEIKDKQSFTAVGEYAAAVVNGWWVLIDEVNAAHPDVVPYLMNQLVPPNRITIKGKSFPAHPEFRLFVTFNVGYAGTKNLNQAFLDRFFPQEVPHPEDDFLKRLLILNGCGDETILNRIVKFARIVWTEHNDMRYELSPRRLYDAIALLNSEQVTDLNEALKLAILPQVMASHEKDAILAALDKVAMTMEVV